MSDQPSASSSSPPSLDDRLIAGLRARRTYLMILEAYRKASPKADFAELLATLIDDTMDAIASLSSALRHVGRSPLQAGINEKLLQQGVRRRGTASKANFLLVGSARTVAWYREMPAAEDPPEVQVLWKELADTEEAHVQLLKGFLDRVGHPPQQVEA